MGMDWVMGNGYPLASIVTKMVHPGASEVVEWHDTLGGADWVQWCSRGGALGWHTGPQVQDICHIIFGGLLKLTLGFPNFRRHTFDH